MRGAPVVSPGGFSRLVLFNKRIKFDRLPKGSCKYISGLRNGLGHFETY